MVATSQYSQYRTRLVMIASTEMVEISHVVNNEILDRFPVPTLKDIREHISNPRTNGRTNAIGDFLIFRTFFNKRFSQDRSIVSAEFSGLSSHIWNTAENNVRGRFKQLAMQTMSMFRDEVPIIWDQE
ncbi:618_t:CDS:1 [Paraglomus brasilianum]|uniref:618_t:CDS:1 n=1 Tax=Paraglomus brasilianum TaxID=144538 RepID=A0A9N9GH18_9GLOM|nr:618_t:CDS:1 [Paraglomus brasilianum]